MPNIGPLEVLVVLIIALVVFGPKRLPELGKSLGRGIQEFRGTVTGDHADDERQDALEGPAVAVAPGVPAKVDSAEQRA